MVVTVNDYVFSFQPVSLFKKSTVVVLFSALFAMFISKVLMLMRFTVIGDDF